MGEHFGDIEGVAGSIPAAPTISFQYYAKLVSAHMLLAANPCKRLISGSRDNSCFVDKIKLIASRSPYKL